MKVKFKILQIQNVDECKYVFRDWIYAEPYFNINDYITVFEDNFNSDTGEVNSICDLLYVKYNRVSYDDVERMKKENFNGHSISISDIIIIDGEEGVGHYCDIFGWKSIKI